MPDTSYEEQKQHKYYQTYRKKRKKILDKYSEDMLNTHTVGKRIIPYSKEQREEHQAFCKEIMDEIFKPHSNYQKWTWEIMSQMEKQKMIWASTSRKNKYI